MQHRMRKGIALALTGLWLAAGAWLAPAHAAPKLVKGIPLPPARPKPVQTEAEKAEPAKADPAKTEAQKPAAEPSQAAKTAEPTPVAEKSEEERKGWKPVKTPLPPRLDKKWRIAALKADKEKAEKDKLAKAAEKARPNATQVRAGEVAPGIPAVNPPQPQATGIFAAFANQSPQDGGSSPSDGAVVRPPANANAFASISGPATKVAKLSLPNPLKNKPAPSIREESEDDDDEEDEAEESTPGSIRKQVASVQTACLQPQLLAMIKKAGEHFGGEAVITSGYRSRGRRGSYHRKCAAADFQIDGVTPQQLVAYLRKMPGAGGVGTYCHTKSVHLDTGTPRDWHQCLFHRRFALRAPVAGSVE